MSTNRPLERLGVDPDLIEKLNTIGINTGGEFIMANPLLLSNIGDISIREINDLQKMISEKIKPSTTTVYNLLTLYNQQQRFLPTNIPQLDEALKGGLFLGNLVDLCGGPGVGKTQFCMSLCVKTLAEIEEKKIEGSVIYIDTELKFDVTRVLQMACLCYPNLFSISNENASENIENFMKRLKILRPKQFEDYEKMIEELEENTINFSSKLIIIDSITHIIKKKNLTEKEKENFFTYTTNKLKNIAEKCYCVVLVTNQLKIINEKSLLKENNLTEEEKEELNQSSSISSSLITSSVLNKIFLNKILYGEIIKDYDQFFIPTLGPLWYHCVNIRLVMNRHFKSNPNTESIRSDFQQKINNMMRTEESEKEIEGGESNNRKKDTFVQDESDSALDKLFATIDINNYSRFITIEKSPLVAKTSFVYEINDKGINIISQD